MSTQRNNNIHTELYIIIILSDCAMFFQMELVLHYPPSEVENLSVWRHVLLRALSLDARHRVEADIIRLTQEAMTEWQNGGCKLGQVNKVVRTTSDLGYVRDVAVIHRWMALCLLYAHDAMILQASNSKIFTEGTVGTMIWNTRAERCSANTKGKAEV